MSGLDILGGLGKGVMIGADQIRRQEAHDANLASQQEQLAMQRKQQETADARLSMLQENQGWQRNDRARQEEERQRVDALGKLRTGVEANYSDLPDFEREEMFLSQGLRMNLFKPEEIQAAKSARDGLYQNFGVEAVDAAVFGGDAAKLQAIAAKKFPGMQIAVAGDTFQITGPDGQTKPLSRSGLAQMFNFSKVVDKEAARAAAELASKKTGSEITENEAQAAAARAQASKDAAAAAGQKLENEGLAALDPKVRPSTTKGGSLPASVQEAQWYERATPEQRAIYERVKKISADPNIAKAALGIITNSVRPITPEQAVAQAEEVYRLSGATGERPAAPGGDKPVQVKTPADAQALPPGTLYVTPDGRQMRR